MTSRFVFALALLLLVQPALAAKLYRWVDDQGNVHYSDKVPPEHSGSARSELDPRGLTIGETGAAKTAEEIARQAELERMRAAQQRQIEKQAAADRVLLRTFRSDDDIELARDGKLAAIDVLIQITRSNIKQLKITLEEMQANAAHLERSGKPVSARFQKQIEETRQRLKESYDDILRKEKEKEEIRQKYDADLERFRTLKKLSTPQRDKPSRAGSLVLDSVYQCRDADDCDRAWKLAEHYVEKHATTGIQVRGNFIVMAARPVKDTDISLTVSRIRESRVDEVTGEPKTYNLIFMDLQCRNSPGGRDFCATKDVAALRSAFRGFLEDKSTASEVKTTAPRDKKHAQ
jgi:hypothetical protein